MTEPFLTMVVVGAIPRRGGIEIKQSAARNGQISLSPGDLLRPRSGSDCLAGLRPQSGSRRARGAGQGRPAGTPCGGLELLDPGLAGYRRLLSAKREFRGENPASAPCHRPTLSIARLLRFIPPTTGCLMTYPAPEGD